MKPTRFPKRRSCWIFPNEDEFTVKSTQLEIESSVSYSGTGTTAPVLVRKDAGAPRLPQEPHSPGQFEDRTHSRFANDGRSEPPARDDVS